MGRGSARIAALPQQAAAMIGASAATEMPPASGPPHAWPLAITSLTVRLASAANSGFVSA